MDDASTAAPPAATNQPRDASTAAPPKAMAEEADGKAVQLKQALFLSLHEHRETMGEDAVHALQTILIPHPPEPDKDATEPPARPVYSVTELVAKVEGWLKDHAESLTDEAKAAFRAALVHKTEPVKAE